MKPDTLRKLEDAAKQAELSLRSHLPELDGRDLIREQVFSIVSNLKQLQHCVRPKDKCP